MSKKPTSNRLDKLFEDINEEAANPEKKPRKKSVAGVGERITVTRSPRAGAKPVVHASTLAQTTPLPPPTEAITLAQPGSESTPATLSLGFQLDQRNWATLQVVDERAVRVWDENEQTLVRQVADQLSQALENARLFQETRSRAEELDILNEMGRVLTTQFDVEEIASTIYKYTGRLMDATNLFISLYDEAKQEINPFFVVNDNQRVPSARRKLGKGFSDYILRTRETLFIPEDVPGRMKKLGLEALFLANTKDMAQCWLGSPLMVGDTPIGVIGVQSVVVPNLYTERHRDLLIAIAGRAAVSIENARLFQEVRRRAQEMTTLAEVGREISATLDLQVILEKIAERALNLLNAVTSAVYMPSADFKMLKPTVVLGEDAEEIKKNEVEVGTGIIGMIAQTHQGEIINNATVDPRAVTIQGTEDVPDERLMAVPILSQGELSGVMAVWRVGPGTDFQPSELEFLASLAQQASIAVENARLFREARTRAEELAVLNELAQRLSARLDVDQVLQEIYRGVSRLIDTSNFYIGLYSPERNEVTFPLNVSESVIDKSIVTIRADQGLTGYILRTRASLLIPDHLPETMQKLGIDVVGEPSKSWLGVPLMLGDQVIGVMALQTYTQTKAYNDHDRDLLVAFAGQAAISIQNARLFTETQRRSYEISTLAEIANGIAASHELQPTLESIAQRASKFLEVEDIAIFLSEPDSQSMRARVAIGKYSQEIFAETLIIGKGITGSVAQTGIPEIVNAPEQDPRSVTVTGTPEEENYSEIIMLAPVISRGKVIGVINVWRSREMGLFTERELNFLVNLARQAAIAVDSTSLFAEVQQRNEQLATLNEIATTASQSLDLKVILTDVLQKVFAALQFDGGLVTIFNEKRGKLERAVRIGLPGTPPDDPAEGLQSSLCEYVYQTGKPLAINDLRQGAPVNVQDSIDAGFYGYLGLPLVSKGITIGTLCVFRKNADPIAENAIVLGQSIGNQIGFAAENARLFQETQRRAMIERLTGEISTSFVSVSPADTDKGIESALQSLGEFIQVDRAYVFLFRQDAKLMDNTHEWGAPGVSSRIVEWQNVPTSAFPYLMKSLKRLGAFRASRIADLPEEAAAEKAEFSRQSIQSITCIPMILRNELIGFIGLDSVKEEHIWEDDELNLLRIMGDIFVTAVNRRNTALALEKSEADLRALFASMEDVVLVVDKDTRYVRIAPTNPSRLFRPPQELLGQRMDEILPAETHEPFRKAIRQALDTDEAVQIEYRLPIGDQQFWFLANITRLNDDQVFWIARDITGRKKAEEDILKFKLGIDQSTDAVFITELDGTITYVNPGFEKVYGYSSAEAIGKTPRIIKSGLLTQENYKQFWDGLLNKQTVSGEIINKTKDGRFISIAGANSPIMDETGTILGFLAVHHDITDLKQAEEALKRRNEYLSATSEIGRLVTSTLDMPTLFSRTVNLVRDRFGFYHAGIFVTEETGFNAVLQEATGEAGSEMKRKKHSLPVGSKSVVGGATETGQPVVVNDTAQGGVHKPNPLLPETRAEVAIPLRVGSRTIGALDIQSTQPNAFSENDIAVLQTLADQVAIAIDNARSYELSMQAVKEMREADRLKSQFLANMSHELRTPLNSIIGFSRVILKGIDGPITDLQQQDLFAIHNSGQHLLGLINDILDLSRIEAGKMELTFDEVQLPELINSVMSTVTGLVRDKPIQLVREIPAELPTVRADSMRIRQVLLNLLSNASKFTDEGAITVTALVMDKPGERQEIMVRVTDTGPGISPEDQKKLFQPFSQVDASPTRKTGGSGLGLSISNHLVQMHGGRMGVESDTGQGSTFFFTLPAFRVKTPEAAETAAPGSRTILVIDDDPQVISLYERYLQPQGYQVVSVSDSARAFERAKQLKPFAITLDIMMPGYDGWHVLNDLKSNPETRDIPVVVCSIIEEQEKGFSLGAADYLLKPILEDDLLNALDRLNPDGSIREVLIIDDKPDDLRLISKILTEHGRYHPFTAEGGANGWDAIQARAPHAVILDLFMPEMDGFAILEKMRLDDKLRDVPVIVVSAYDLTPEQQAQLQEFGQRMIQKSSLTEKQLLDTLDQVLKRVAK